MCNERLRTDRQHPNLITASRALSPTGSKSNRDSHRNSRQSGISAKSWNFFSTTRVHTNKPSILAGSQYFRIPKLVGFQNILTKAGKKTKLESRNYRDSENFRRTGQKRNTPEYREFPGSRQNSGKIQKNLAAFSRFLAESRRDSAMIPIAFSLGKANRHQGAHII